MTQRSLQQYRDEILRTLTKAIDTSLLRANAEPFVGRSPAFFAADIVVRFEGLDQEICVRPLLDFRPMPKSIEQAALVVAKVKTGLYSPRDLERDPPEGMTKDQTRITIQSLLDTNVLTLDNTLKLKIS